MLAKVSVRVSPEDEARVATRRRIEIDVKRESMGRRQSSRGWLSSKDDRASTHAKERAARQRWRGR